MWMLEEDLIREVLHAPCGKLRVKQFAEVECLLSLGVCQPGHADCRNIIPYGDTSR
jgi:hypothetical protein